MRFERVGKEKGSKDMTKENETKQEQTTAVQTKKEEAPLALTPFGLVRRFAEEMERLFQDFEGFRFPHLFKGEFFPLRKELEQVAWVPPIEVRHHNGEMTVRADLPGLTKDDVKVEVTKEALSISGERKEEREEKREGYYRSERSYGRFYRQIPLPEGATTDKATATFRNGVLEVTIQVPKSEPESRRLEITMGEETPKAKAATQ
jgi:HSP20 family protein